MRVSGFTSTGSKRPLTLFGGVYDDLPHRMTRSEGAKVWDERGREYLDFISALGAVGLGYAHSHVIRAAVEAMERGGIGPLAPVDEELLAGELVAAVPVLDEVRFLKTGAEAVAAAVRLARTATGRDLVLGCGYHGWLDWCSSGPGVPAAVSGLYRSIPFNDAEECIAMIRRAGNALACVVIEPVVEEEPTAEWLRALRDETWRLGVVLVYDEIKTAFRVAEGGAAMRWGGEPDLVVMGKALANGFPLAAVGGRAEIMRRANDTWISSTMATDFVSFAAARATLAAVREVGLPARLADTGGVLFEGLKGLAAGHADRVAVSGIPEMCYLRFADERTSQRVAQGCARRGLLFKRNAYNFVTLAHTNADVLQALGILDAVLRETA